MRSLKITRCLAFAFLLIACMLLAAVSSTPAWGTVVCGAEAISCGGCAGVSLSCRAHDSVAQGPIGPVAEGRGIRAHDGFFLVLPCVNVPVEGAYFAEATESGAVVVRWTLASLGNVDGINVYRSTFAEGPFFRINKELLPAESPGVFEDSSVWPETTFWYEIRLLLNDGTEDVLTGSPTMVTTAGHLALALDVAHPNPFRESTSLRFDVPSHAGPVRLAVFNIRGQEIRRLVDGSRNRGRHQLIWDGRDSTGRLVSSGVYFTRLEVDGDSRIQKVMVLR